MPHSSPHSLHKTLTVATSNAGKLRELRALLAGLPFEIVSNAQQGVSSPAENGATFLENALLKARHAALVTCGAALADDSGLEVDALGGAPGIHSARFAGSEASDEKNNRKLIEALCAVPLTHRCARYRCVLVFVEAADDPHPAIAHGVWEGSIIDERRGSGGFGYDPHFWLPSHGCTVAELDAGEKNRISHRGIALRALRAALVDRLGNRPCDVGNPGDP